MRKELSEKEIEAFEVVKEFLADIYLSLLENDGYIAIDGSFERYNRIDVYNQYKIVNHLIENATKPITKLLRKLKDNGSQNILIPLLGIIYMLFHMAHPKKNMEKIFCLMTIAKSENNGQNELIILLLMKKQLYQF